MFRQGDTFWIPSSDSGIEHLHVIISNPEINHEDIVVVPLTTRETWVEETCVLYVGDHPAIKHDTCVDYRRADIVSAIKLDAALTKQQIRKNDTVSSEILKDILSGANETRFLPGRCDRVLSEQKLID